LVGHLVLAAADFDRDTFAQQSEEIKEMARVITLYVSENDWALNFSEVRNGYPRVGQGVLGSVFRDMFTIDATAADASLFALWHDYDRSRAVMTDIHSLLTYNSPPDQRVGLEKRQTGELPYWYMRP
jgi:esterase/lipase superfamily enzyme